MSKSETEEVASVLDIDGRTGNVDTPCDPSLRGSL
jgi:hypothetical protein